MVDSSSAIHEYKRNDFFLTPKYDAVKLFLRRNAMKQITLSIVICSFALVSAFGTVQSDLQDADRLHKEFKYTDEKTLLLGSLGQAGTQKDKYDILWRLARVTLKLGDDAEDRGVKKEELLKVFEEGEKYANQAIEANPNGQFGYFWKSSNIGRWGQVKGILDSLGKAEPMQKLLVKAIEIDSEHADSYFVLGELYDELPGWPISFGNIDFAVSYARKSIAANEKQVAEGKAEKDRGFYIKLAKHLYKRNWSPQTRTNELKNKLANYNSKKSILEKSGYFEGTLTLENVSDRDEAKKIVNGIIQELEGMASRNKTENDNLKDAKDLVKTWQ